MAQKSMISLVGRPNVGKSSLFNALTRKKQALVMDFEGVTRDRRFATVPVEALRNKLVKVCDTGGWMPEGWRKGREDQEMLQNIEAQIMRALEESAVIVLVMSAVSWMAALRTGLRAMFDLPPDRTNVVVGKLRELAGLAGLSVGVLVSAILGVALTSAVHWFLGALGLRADAAWLVVAVGALVSLVVDALTFALLVVVLAGVHPPRRDLLAGSLVASVGLGAVRQLGTSVVAGSVGRNALLASFAVLVTLLVWVNLVARIVLLSAAWVATPPLPAAAPSVSSGARRA